MDKDYLTPKEASEIAKVTEVTIVAWCKEYGIGTKCGGRWRIDPKEFKKVLDGTIHEELKRPQREEGDFYEEG